MTSQQELLASLIKDKGKFMETLLVIEDKSQKRVPFILNPIQRDAQATETGRDIWVKPAQVGFSSERLANRFIDTITTPGTNTVLIAYEEFITQRLLDKVQFFYDMINSLNIPGFPKIFHKSSFEKTFPSIHSSMYISSARSYVAGRAETIHHLLCDEFAFWEPGATDRILSPAMDRVPPTGTVDVFSTPNGENNDFCDIYRQATEGNSVFTPHFYPWFMHPEYKLALGSPTLAGDNAPRWAKELNTNSLPLNSDEQNLINNFNLTLDQIRWRKYKIREKESLRRGGGMIRLFQQEFPEDDISCFLAAGDMFYSPEVINEKAKNCYPAPYHRDFAEIWYPPEPNKWYTLAIDPGQAKVTQSAMVVITYDDNVPKYCARAAGLWTPEVTADKARDLAHYYNDAVIAWEANSHGLALAPLLKDYPNVYYRRDVITGRMGAELGWYTSSKTKDFMLHILARALHNMIVHDTIFLSECRNIRLSGEKAISIGADDIHDATAIALVCSETQPIERGLVGYSGWKW